MSRFFKKTVMSEGENSAYHCDIVPDFPTWQKETLRTKSSKELRRLRRRFEEEFGALRLETVSAPEDIDRVTRFIQTARQGRFEEDLLQRDVYFNFYREYMKAAAPGREARLFALYYEDNLLSALYGLTGDGDFHAVLIASDLARFERFSVGNHMLLETMQQLASEGVTRFDMGPGNFRYKKFFGATQTPLNNYTSARTVLGKAVAATYHYAKPLKNILKKYVPNIR